ncbi:MAG: hypothetical protein PHH59_06035 [Methylovulum sp.]|uniref:hypothetical protein n=1 Tax=Methylovulum sp. TaxID=1916980 RepID=UPI002625EF22|nr:hypothetical protein [Methylovulum sp.]MDD2723565.1 hypothetical protein [Methylovulum sp.]MDD5124169.1 hypothetical protein [Methylovulum sp.]
MPVLQGVQSSQYFIDKSIIIPIAGLPASESLARAYSDEAPEYSPAPGHILALPLYLSFFEFVHNVRMR